MKEAITNYLSFMYCKWQESMPTKIFGKVMGDHYWEKWCYLCKVYGSWGAMSKFWDELDDEHREILCTYIETQKK